MNTPDENSVVGPGGDVAVYEIDGDARVDVRLEQDTVWLSQRDMASVFATTPENVLMHLRNVYSCEELEAGATTKDFLVVQTEGTRQVRRSILHYNLDAIISVGYRVNSKQAVRFRQWSTRTLRKHLVRGYTLNEQRLAERGLDEARNTLDSLNKAKAYSQVAFMRQGGILAFAGIFTVEGVRIAGNPSPCLVGLRRSLARPALPHAS